MEHESLVHEALAAFEAGRFDEALKCFKELLRGGELPERHLFEIGVCELRCAVDEDGFRRGLDLLERVPPGHPRHAEALKEMEELAATREHRLRDEDARRALEDARRFMDQERYLEALATWEESLGGGSPRRTLVRMAAVAWHKLADAALARSYLERLRGEDRDCREAFILRRAMVGGMIERIRTLIRLGLRRSAFDELVRLRRDEGLDEAARASLDEIQLEHLGAPWARLLRERLRRNDALMFRMREKDSPVWKLLRTARGRVDGDEELDRVAADDDPGLLPRVLRETALLRRFEARMDEYERRIPACSPDDFMRVAEDREGLETFEAILRRVPSVVRQFVAYAETSHLEVKDFLGSFLPSTIRSRVCNEDYLRVVRLEAELEQDLVTFLRSRYPAAAGGSR